MVLYSGNSFPIIRPWCYNREKNPDYKTMVYKSGGLIDGTNHGHSCRVPMDYVIVWWEDLRSTQELSLFHKPRVGHLLNI